MVVSVFPEIHAKRLAEFTVSAFDQDSDDVLTVIWGWGDGTTTLSGVASTSHENRREGVYSSTVTDDDCTGLPGHVVPTSRS